MAIILCQAILETDSGLPEDRITNTFHFNGLATDPVAEDLSVAIADFYNGTTGIIDDVATFLSPELTALSTGCQLKFYDVTSGPGGTPYYEDTFGLNTPTAGAALPSEVACCLSYKSTPLAGANEARRRGRIYIGPLNVNACNFGAPSRPATAFQESLLAGAQRLHDAAETANAPWVVYSRANDTTSLIDIAWVDNAFDTQRRRGPAATARVTEIL